MEKGSQAVMGIGRSPWIDAAGRERAPADPDAERDACHARPEEALHDTARREQHGIEPGAGIGIEAEAAAAEGPFLPCLQHRRRRRQDAGRQQFGAARSLPQQQQHDRQRQSLQEGAQPGVEPVAQSAERHALAMSAAIERSK
jgi:hypothetical protein